ncbi:hypothetical protein CRUP_007182 [Coryphaenoides rupestris]|nr:hypothetical protein CRUP_007182 [Coryphaenoides rupestris]
MALRSSFRLCALLQDTCGVFSVLQLQPLDGPQELQLYTQRYGGVFHLIDSVWPPAGPSQGRIAGSAPCFCYLLSGHEGSLEPLEGPALSLLYLPPKELTLREVLEGDVNVRCCSFAATVVYARMQGERAEGGPCRRTVAVCVATSCVLTPSVAAAMRSPSGAILSFRDIVRENGALLCTEQSVVRTLPARPGGCPGPTVPTPGPLAPRPARPVRLDPLGPDTAANSLCTLTGVIVGVDESTACSWPACSFCGSDRLEVTQEEEEEEEGGGRERRALRCAVCNSEVREPVLRLRLEVTLVPSAALGPIPAFVRVVRRTPALWIGVDEISLEPVAQELTAQGESTAAAATAEPFPCQKDHVLPRGDLEERAVNPTEGPPPP